MFALDVQNFPFLTLAAPKQDSLFLVPQVALELSLPENKRIFFFARLRVGQVDLLDKFLGLNPVQVDAVLGFFKLVRQALVLLSTVESLTSGALVFGLFGPKLEFGLLHLVFGLLELYSEVLDSEFVFLVLLPQTEFLQGGSARGWIFRVVVLAHIGHGLLVFLTHVGGRGRERLGWRCWFVDRCNCWQRLLGRRLRDRQKFVHLLLALAQTFKVLILVDI